MKKGIISLMAVLMVMALALVSCTQEQGLDLVQVTLNLNDVTKALGTSNNFSVATYGITAVPTAGEANSYGTISSEKFFAKNAQDTISLTLSRGEWTFTVNAYSDGEFEGGSLKTAPEKKVATGSTTKVLSTSVHEVTVNLATTSTNASSTEVTVIIGSKSAPGSYSTDNSVSSVATADEYRRLIVRYYGTSVSGSGTDCITGISANVKEGAFDYFYGSASFTADAQNVYFSLVYQVRDDEEAEWADLREEIFNIDVYDGMEITVSNVLTAEEANANTIQINNVTVSMTLAVSGSSVTATTQITHGEGTVSVADNAHEWTGPFDTKASTGTTGEDGKTTSSNTVNLTDANQGIYNISCRVPVTIKTAGTTDLTIYASASKNFKWDGTELSAL